MKVVALAGGVGGAKLADGLRRVLSAGELTVIVNTGDDFEHFGLKVCPDLDTVCYTLADLSNSVTGWGRAGETWGAISNIKTLGGPGWFQMGDQDLGTHLERTRRLRAGDRLSQITADFCRAWGIEAQVLPMTDAEVSTWVHTSDAGVLPFQEYFVHQGCKPVVTGFEFRGAETAQAAPGVAAAINDADFVIVCPSNPMVSIGPIRSIGEIKAAIDQKSNIVAVSPIIGGMAVKGPAAKMFLELGVAPSAYEVAKQYREWVNLLLVDHADQHLESSILDLGMRAAFDQILMTSTQDRVRLAERILEICYSLSIEAL